jgi:hypothetical protein
MNAFKRVEALPVSSMISAFIPDVFGSLAVVEDFDERKSA